MLDSRLATGEVSWLGGSGRMQGGIMFGLGSRHKLQMAQMALQEALAQLENALRERDAYLQQRDIALGERNEFQRQRDLALAEIERLKPALAPTLLGALSLNFPVLVE